MSGVVSDVSFTLAIYPEWLREAAAALGMANLSFDERGLLRILERVLQEGDGVGAAVRFGLAERGLVERDGPTRLSASGERVLVELRVRSARPTGEWPAFGEAPIQTEATD